MSDSKDQFEHYVYIYFDPINKDPFYVGKGQGPRIHSHQAEAEKWVEKEDETESLTANEVHPKVKKINRIIEVGNEPLKLVIGRYRTAAEAFAVESTLMHWVYGKRSLTNIQNGHKWLHIRQKDDYELRDRLELKTKARGPSGEFSKKNEALWIEHGITDHLECLAESLRPVFGEALKEISEPYMRKKQDAVIHLDFSWEHLLVRLKMGLNSKHTIQVNLSPREDIKKDKQVLIDLIARKKQQWERNDGYGFVKNEWNNKTISEHKIDEIIRRIYWYKALVDNDQIIGIKNS